MRYLLPVALAAALALPGTSPAQAKQSRHPRPEPVASHVSLHVSRHSLLYGGRLLLQGKVGPGGPHRVKVVVGGPEGGLLITRTNPSGAFAVRWKLSRTGTYRARAFGIHERGMKGSASPARLVTVYKRVEVSYYGPGLYGNGVACGGTLWPGTLGVANKTLPCGTMVKLRYHGRSVTVPVIDRGPYVAGREFDLTTATKERLGFPGLGVVLSSR
jgi:rare lipoprotein A